jgi:DNA-directed RNA polymerase specialized sigma24 family protein
MAELKKNWTLNRDAFRRFLSWLDSGVDSHGDSYLEMRRRLVLYFDRKNCAASEDLADETFNRVARKLEEKGTITDITPAHYCYIVAKFVFLESLRKDKLAAQSVEALSEAGVTVSSLTSAAVADSTREAREEVLGCLEKCLRKLATADRDLILEYYRGKQREKIERRSQLAANLGLSSNALSIRACRVRNKLEVCVRACCGES